VAPPEPDKRNKPTRPIASRSKPRRQPDISAAIVPVPAICDLTRGKGGADGSASWVAERQLGLITTRQLIAAGISRDAITTRCRRGTLHRVHHGVYAFGAAILLPGARELAAVLACGESALVSHRSAAALWGFASRSPDQVDVTVAAGDRRQREGLRVHRVAGLDDGERRSQNGIPITSPARTLLDFAAQAAPQELESAIAEAYALRLTSERELRTTLSRHRHRSGAGKLSAELALEGGPAWTRSEAERQMRRLLREARLPPPLVNVPVAGFTVDFFWPANRLIVEVDGYRFHGHRRAFENDRRRQTALVAAGHNVIRVTWRQIRDEPLAVIAAIAQALSLTDYGSRAPH
jgi:very-short-patch-repair endonuclease